MPAGTRIRTDNVYGTLSGALTSGATSMSSAGLANLAAVSGGHAVVVLDPLRAAGAPEVVFVTAHTASATTATISRGGYGTAARAHTAGTLWVHAPTIEDFVRIVTAATRPTDPYEGQLIYETDTDSYKGYSGSAWEQALSLGAWQSWTPTLSNLTLGAGTISAKYQKVARTLFFRFRFTLGSGSAVGTAPEFTLPFTPGSDYNGAQSWMGVAVLTDTGTATHIGYLQHATGGCRINHQVISGTTIVRGTVTASAPFTWVSGDVIEADGFCEVAA